MCSVFCHISTAVIQTWLKHPLNPPFHYQKCCSSKHLQQLLFCWRKWKLCSFICLLVLCWRSPSSFCGIGKALILIIVCVSLWSSIWPSFEVMSSIFSKCKLPTFYFCLFFPFKSHWEDWQDWIDVCLWQKAIVGLMILWPTSPCNAVADVPCGCGCAYAKISWSGKSSSFSNAVLHVVFCSVSWQHVPGTRFGDIPLLWAALLYMVRICTFLVSCSGILWAY